MRELKIIVEKHADGYVAYPLGLKGVVIGQGETFDEAVEEVTSGIRAHVEAFGPGVLEGEDEVMEVFVTRAALAG